MSLATEYAPSVPLPIAARALTCVPDTVPDRVGDRAAGVVAPGSWSQGLASVTVLRPPADAASVPLRLTRRGVVVIAAAVAVLGAVLVWLAALSAPRRRAGPGGRPGGGDGPLRRHAVVHRGPGRPAAAIPAPRSPPCSS